MFSKFKAIKIKAKNKNSYSEINSLSILKNIAKNSVQASAKSLVTGPDKKLFIQYHSESGNNWTNSIFINKFDIKQHFKNLSVDDENVIRFGKLLLNELSLAQSALSLEMFGAIKEIELDRNYNVIKLTFQQITFSRMHHGNSFVSDDNEFRIHF
jgi:hypothetical protein